MLDAVVKDKKNEIKENRNDQEFNEEYENDLKKEIEELKEIKGLIEKRIYKGENIDEIAILSECYFFGCLQHNRIYK